MKGWWPLFKKEILEQIRTYRWLIVGGIFLFFGLTTPLSFKYLPEILKLAGPSAQINLPAFTALDSLAKFSATLSQIGTVVILLAAMGSVANEYKNGTVFLVLIKPVTHFSFVSAKFAAAACNLVFSLVVSSLVCFGYTVWLIGPAGIGAFFLQVVLLGLFLIFCLSLTLLFSSMFKSGLAAFAMSGIVIIIIAFVSSLPTLGNFLPGKLPGWGVNIIYGVSQPYWWALGITLGLIGLCLYLSQLILKKKEV